MDGVNSYLLADEQAKYYGLFDDATQERQMRTELGINYVSSDLVYDYEGQYLENEQLSS